MKASEQLQLDVVDELAYSPEVDSSRISVTAREDGVVVLKGTVPTYTQRRAAAKAAQRIRGVKGLVNDLEVRLPEGDVGDPALAEAALRALRGSSSVPRDAVKVTVSRGMVTLEGRVDWEYQRRAAHDVVSDLLGVRGVSNQIAIEPKVEPQDIKRRIEDAFRRSAQIDAAHVTVESAGGKVTLRGTVRSLAEKDDAGRAAWAPGVTMVDNRIAVEAHVFA